MDDFRGISVADVAEQVRSGEVTARAQVEKALAAIEAYNPTIGAFVAVDAQAALAAADDVDQRVAAGEDPGPLAGVPLGVKDLEDAVGFVTTHGSALHRDDPPATKDSVLVERLRAAGCVIVGKTNTPEFGWQGETSNEIFPPTTNPWNPARSAGGSSGGTGAALAAGMVPLATGSDGGGSIRIPSALNGLSGLKPSRGRIPIGGPTMPNWYHYSIPGPMARTITDVALALDVAVGPEATDLTSLPRHRGESWYQSLTDLQPPRAVLWSPNLGYGNTDQEVADICAGAVERLASSGVEVFDVDAFDHDPVMDWITIAYGGLYRQLGRHRGTPAWEQITPGLRSMMELVVDATATDALDALAAGHAANYRLVTAFHQAPLLLTPTVAGQTAETGKQGTINGEENFAWVGYTYPFNMTGNPAGTVCAGHTADGMPVGLQVIGPQHADIAVLRTMAFIEGLLDVDTVAPLDWAD